YNLIGVAALNLVFSVPDFTADARHAFDQGLRIVTPDNLNAIWYLHFNRWRLFLVTGDAKVNEEVAQLKNLRPPPDVDPWGKARDWKWFKTLFASKPALALSAERSYRSFLQAAAR